MTDAELDRLDLLVAEAMGEKTNTINYKGVPIYRISGSDRLDWSPTRNAMHRDEAEDHFAKLGWLISLSLMLEGDSLIYRSRVSKQGHTGHAIFAATRGEAVCRAIEELVKQGALA